MTVAEAIEFLRQYPDELPVCIVDFCADTTEYFHARVNSFPSELYPCFVIAEPMQ